MRRAVPAMMTDRTTQVTNFIFLYYAYSLTLLSTPLDTMNEFYGSCDLRRLFTAIQLFIVSLIFICHSIWECVSSGDSVPGFI